MAIDAMGNYTVADDTAIIDAATAEEELRRRREEELRRQQQEAARNQPVTQKITYNPDGTQKMTITGTPQALSAGQPNTPTVSGPVRPDDIYNRMIQAESGGRQFNAQGGVLTSPKGAMGVGQVMPSTAMQPGYGVKNIFDMATERGIPVATRDEATARQLLGIEGLNRDFGQAYFNGMQNRFGAGNPAAVAAYNAGPGRVGQNVQANAGQMNVAQLPQETQGYLPKVFGPAVPQTTTAPWAADLSAAQGNPDRLTAIVNGSYPDNVKATAQAQLTELQRQPAPAPAPAPAAQGSVQIDDQGNRLVTTPTGETFAVGPDNRPLPARGVAVEQMGAFGQDFVKNQKNPQALLAIADDNSGKYTAFERKLAKDQVYETVRNQRVNEQAQELITKAKDSGDGRALAKILQDRSEGVTAGRVAQAFLFNLIGFQSGARDVVNKMGINDTYETTTDKDGNAVVIRKAPDGLPKSGITADGKEIPTDQLIQYLGGTGKDFDIVGGTFVNDKTGEVGTVYRSKTNPNQQFVQTDTGRKPLTGFRPQTSSGTASDQRNKLIQDMNIKLQGKTAEQQMTIQQDYNKLLVGQGLAPLQPNDTPLVAPQIGGGQPAAVPATGGQPAAAPATGGQPATGGAVAPTPLTAPAAPAAVPAQRPTATALAAGAEAAKTPVLVRREDEQAYVKFKNDDILPKADAGNRLAGIRRDQISGPDGVLNNPEIAGLLSGTGSQAREFQNIFRDIVGGSFDKVDDMSARIKQSGLDDRMKQVLQIQLQRQREVTPLLIREVAPVGAITDFEQRMAKEAGIDVLRQGLYASLTNLTRSQFQSDMAAYKSVFAERNPELRTRAEFDRAWNAEKSRLDASYRKVYEDRAKYLGQYNRDGRNNNATIVAFRDHYPVPTFDQSTGQFVFGGYSRNAERPPLSSFERR